MGKLFGGRNEGMGLWWSNYCMLRYSTGLAANSFEMG